jgi:hypothetical protein
MLWDTFQRLATDNHGQRGLIEQAARECGAVLYERDGQQWIAARRGYGGKHGIDAWRPFQRAQRSGVFRRLTGAAATWQLRQSWQIAGASPSVGA